jgi:hypothetical protein
VDDTDARTVVGSDAEELAGQPGGERAVRSEADDDVLARQRVVVGGRERALGVRGHELMVDLRSSLPHRARPLR